MNKRWVWALVICALVGYLLYAGALRSADAYAKDVLRLHILANSNSQEDQRIKLCVRDSVLNYIEGNCGEAATKQETAQWVETHLNDIETVAARTVREQGKDYGAMAELGNFDFPSKTYGQTVYLAGPYDALRVSLGAARGENWWCVIFPPLCLTDLGASVPTNAGAETTASASATASPKATAAANRTKTPAGAVPEASPAPEEDEVVGGTGSYAYVNGVRLESLIKNWFGF